MCVFCLSQLSEGPAVRKNGFDQLSECSYIYGAFPAKKSAHDFPLCIKRERLFTTWKIGNYRSCRRSVHCFWEK